MEDFEAVCAVAGCTGRAYVTDLCGGRPHGDSGKFHNHCTLCPNFGNCIGDNRESHCERCGDHFFGGFGSSFKCDCRGGGEETYEDEEYEDEGEDEEAAAPRKKALV